MTSAMTSDRYPLTPGVPSRYGYTWAEARNAVVIIRMKPRAERVLSMGLPPFVVRVDLFARLYPASYNRTYSLSPRSMTSPNTESFRWWHKDVTSQPL